MIRPVIGFKPVHNDQHWKNRMMYQWDGKPKRCPKKGEYYLSGAFVTAYQAKADLTTEYFIAVPTKGN